MAKTSVKRKLKTTGRKRLIFGGFDPAKVKSRRARRPRGMRPGWDPTKIAS